MLPTAATSRFVRNVQRQTNFAGRIRRTLSTMPAFSDNDSAKQQAKELQELAKACSEITNNNSQEEEERRLVPYDVVPKSDFGKYAEYSVIHTNRNVIHKRPRSE